MEKLHYPMILDGGLSNVLENMGCNLEHPLWTARLIQTNPELIVKAHLAYLHAGANCITSSGYQASIEGYLQLGESQKNAEQFILKSLDLAIKSRQLYLGKAKPTYPIKVAASMGPYGAFLADGSEYTGIYNVSDKNLATFHKSRIDLLQNSAADFFAFETIPSLQEVNVISKLLNTDSKLSWLSFSCKNEIYLNDGNKISDAVSLIANHSRIFALGVNCTAPKYITKIIGTLKKIAPQKKIIVYPNSGEAYHAKSKSWHGISDPVIFEKMAFEWAENGASIIGGCCRIGPEHIKRIRRLLNSDSPTISP